MLRFRVAKLLCLPFHTSRQRKTWEWGTGINSRIATCGADGMKTGSLFCLLFKYTGARHSQELLWRLWRNIYVHCFHVDATFRTGFFILNLPGCTIVLEYLYGTWKIEISTKVVASEKSWSHHRSLPWLHGFAASAIQGWHQTCRWAVQARRGVHSFKKSACTQKSFGAWCLCHKASFTFPLLSQF